MKTWVWKHTVYLEISQSIKIFTSRPNDNGRQFALIILGRTIKQSNKRWRRYKMSIAKEAVLRQNENELPKESHAKITITK